MMRFRIKITRNSEIGFLAWVGSPYKNGYLGGMPEAVRIKVY
jgi:hypothetical protein